MDLNASEKSHVIRLMHNVLQETANDVISLLEEDGNYKRTEAIACLIETVLDASRLEMIASQTGREILIKFRSFPYQEQFKFAKKELKGSINCLL